MLSILATFALVGCTDAIRFERAQNIIWISTEYRVDDGAIDMDLDYVPMGDL